MQCKCICKCKYNMLLKEFLKYLSMQNYFDHNNSLYHNSPDQFSVELVIMQDPYK